MIEIILSIIEKTRFGKSTKTICRIEFEAGVFLIKSFELLNYFSTKILS